MVEPKGLTELLVYEATSDEEQRSAQEIIAHTGVEAQLDGIYPYLNLMVFDRYAKQFSDSSELKYLLTDAGVERRKMLKLKAAEN